MVIQTDAEQPARPAVIPSLDGIRAVSIVLVMAGHGLRHGPHSYGFRALFLHPDLGVRIFFVISGFLITRLLLDERARSGTVSLRFFYIRRALRILPAFFLFTGCIALLSFLGVTPIPHGLWLYVLTYTVNYSPSTAWVLNHLWSLSVEEQFYIFWPIVVKSARLRTCVAVAAIAVITSPIAHAVHTLSGVSFSSYGFALRCGPIAMGSLLAMGGGRVRRYIAASKLLSGDRGLLFAALLIAMFDAIPNHFGAPTVFLELVTNFLVTFCVAKLVYFPEGVVGRMLNAAPLVTIGKLSYSLYLWQQVFLVPAGRAPVYVPFPGNLIAIIAIASVSYWGLEVRFLGLRKKFRTQSQAVVDKALASVA